MLASAYAFVAVGCLCAGVFRKTQQAQGHKADDVWYSPFALVKAKQTYHLQRIMFIYYVLAETMATRHPNLPAVTEFCCCCCLSVCTTFEFSWIQLQPCLGDQLMPWWDFLQNNLSPIRYKVPQMSFSCLLRWSRRICPYIRCPHSHVVKPSLPLKSFPAYLEYGTVFPGVTASGFLLPSLSTWPAQTAATCYINRRWNLI